MKLALLALYVIVLAFLWQMGTDRHPLLVQAAMGGTARDNMLFSPCPLTTRNLPPRKDWDA